MKKSRVADGGVIKLQALTFMYEISKLEKTQIVKHLKTQIISLVEKLQEIDQEKSRGLSKEDAYIHLTWLLINEIENKFKDLDACIAFLSSYSKNGAVGKLLTREEYLFYHLEFYYIGVIGIFDRALKLVNHIYGLGLADRYVTLDIITSHRHIDGELSKMLKLFNKDVNNIRTLQNGFKHKQKMRDDKLKTAVLLETAYRYKWLSDSFDKVTRKQCEFLSTLEYRQYIRDKKKELKQTNAALANSLAALFDRSYFEYDKRLRISASKTIDV